MTTSTVEPAIAEQLTELREKRARLEAQHQEASDALRAAQKRLAAGEMSLDDATALQGRVSALEGALTALDAEIAPVAAAVSAAEQEARQADARERAFGELAVNAQEATDALELYETARAEFERTFERCGAQMAAAIEKAAKARADLQAGVARLAPMVSPGEIAREITARASLRGFLAARHFGWASGMSELDAFCTRDMLPSVASHPALIQLALKEAGVVGHHDLHVRSVPAPRV